LGSAVIPGVNPHGQHEIQSYTGIISLCAPSCRRRRQAAQEAVSTFDQWVKASQVGAQDLSNKAMNFAQRNVLSAFEFAQSIVQAKDVQELIQTQAEFVQSQMQVLSEQVKDLREAATKAAMDSLKDLGETASKTAMSVQDLGEAATKGAIKNVKDLSEAATKTAKEGLQDLGEAA
jgi:hypothetical protein